MYQVWVVRVYESKMSEAVETSVFHDSADNMVLHLALDILFSITHGSFNF